VATVPSGCEEVIIGEGSYAVLGRTAEIGFTVAEAWQGRGIASRLLQHLARMARDQGVGEFEAYVLHENAPMLAVFRRSGLPMTTRSDEGVLHVTLVLDPRSRTDLRRFADDSGHATHYAS
jgi:RimJ/RimL family protein N-acetyltransferase